MLPNPLENVIASKWGINFATSRLIAAWHNITYGGVVIPQQTLEPLSPYSTDKLLIRLKRKVNHEISSFVTAECQILTDIHANLDLICPIPLVCLDGRFCHEVEVDGQTWVLTLFRWIEGHTAEKTVPGEYFYRVGELTGKLHHFLQERYTPAALDRPIRDITHLTQQANSLFNPSVAFAKMEKKDRDCFERFLDTHHETFSTIHNRFGHCLIHGDVIQKNIIVIDGRLGLIDFDECAFAPPIFEVAITLRHWRDHPAWAKIVNSYLRGYGQWFDISEELRYLDYFIGLRHLLICFWVVYHSSRNPQIERIREETLENGCNFLARL